jgi:hypothetical protein
VTASPNVKLVRSIYTAWELGDFSSTELAHPEIEVVIADGPEPGASTGVAGALERASTILDAWEGWRPEVEEYRAGRRACPRAHPTWRARTPDRASPPPAPPVPSAREVTGHRRR